MNLLLDHLWQSTAVLAVIGVLTLFFRNNGAGVRHSLWLAASLKFLVPFAVLNWLGSQLSGIFAQPLPASVVQAVYGASQPFSDGIVFEIMPAPASPNWLPLVAIWGIGTIALLAVWTVRWMKLHKTVRAARDANIAAPMNVKLSAAQLEPGLVGIFRPVLLLPEGIAEKLTQAELQSILAHEICHMRRHDNLTALLHMLVQAVFWFWPPVWWLGTRLIAERERACDEAVVAGGNDPQVYAESILKICKHYVSSPLACAAGVSGADLKQRMEEIMKNAVIARLDFSRKALLVVSTVAAFSLPMALGIMPVPVALAQEGACKLSAMMQTHTLPPYPVESARAGETGTVRLRVTITRDGHASGATVLDSSGSARLDDAAASHVRQYYRWQPLACDSAQTNVRVVFALAAPAAGVRPIGFDASQPGTGLVIRAVDEQAGRAGADAVRMREDGVMQTVWLRREGQIAGNIVREVGIGTDARNGQTAISVRFTAEGQRLLADMSTKNVGKRIAILVDGNVLSAPTVNEPILGGQTQLSGNFDMDEARVLAAKIIAGSTER